MGNKNRKVQNTINIHALPKENVASTTSALSMPKSSETTVPVIPTQPSILPDGVTIVWLDIEANSNSNDGYTTKTMLDKIHPSTFTFDDVKNCLDFLSRISNKKSRVFLVVSGKFSTLILPNFKKLPALDSVFIFCAHPEKYEHLVSEYFPHVIGVFSQQEALQSCLEIELNNFHKRAAVFNFFAQEQSATRDLTYDAASFLWFQLLQKVLMKTKYDANDMKQMLNYCREHYERDAQQRKFFSDIAEFEKTYTSADAINWYTRQSFIYKLINTALRTEDIEALYIFRFYISDLCRQLANEHQKFCIQNKKSPILKLYRGCHMTLEELDKLHDAIGGMISLNGFVSTTLLKWVAEQFLSHESRRRTEVEKVLWFIEADICMNDVIFAYVAPFSKHPEEEEVLFNIGSAFRIDDVVLDETTNVWHVKATATNAGSRAVSEYMELIKHELDETSEKVIFGTLLMDMGKYVTAQCYFENLIQRSDKFHPDLAAFHYNLGLTYSFQRDLNLAEQNFLQALEYQKLNSMKRRNMVRTLNALGWLHQDNGELSKAINFYKKAESICSEKLGYNDLANAQTYTYMGRYYLERQQYNESNTYYERALEILRLRLSKQHQRFGIILNEMGDLKRKQGDPKEALKLYQQAEDIFRDILPQHHPCMAYCWSGMGLVFLQLKDIEEAQRYHKKALKSYKRALPPNHINISISEKNLKCSSYDHIIDSYLQVCSQV
jgi:tetratricopeptide (TPR) repeat protein